MLDGNKSWQMISVGGSNVHIASGYIDENNNLVLTFSSTDVPSITVDLSSLEANSAIELEHEDGSLDYTLKQGNNTIGIINIPKDMML